MTSGTEWWATGAEEVADGVVRIPLPLYADGLRAVNVYGIRSDDGVVLIDGGWAVSDSIGFLDTELARFGHRLTDITDIYVTHLHRDHYTQAVVIRDRVGARLAVGDGEKPGLVAMAEAARTGSRTGSLDVLKKAGALALLPDPGRGNEHDPSVWQEPDIWLTDAQQLTSAGRTLTVVATPGHTAGHVVFRDDAASLLFAGDHVLPHITPSIGFEAVPPPWPLRDYIDSLKLILGLPDTRLLPAHGPVTESVHDRVRALLEHHGRRLDDTEAAVRRGAATGWEVASALTWTRRQRRLDELDLPNQRLAICETVAHLDVLTLQHRLVSSADDDGVATYAAVA
jgi:glyoxylase-like metal-dependent hydrolase (beta-lactamase superfamily II)